MSCGKIVTCSSCGKSNFYGLLYKCLRCPEVKHCCQCYIASNRIAEIPYHRANHPMQCLLTIGNLKINYGEKRWNLQSELRYTCPYCSKRRRSEATLLEHVLINHTFPTVLVICPVCVAKPNYDHNHHAIQIYEFVKHLMMDHTIKLLPASTYAQRVLDSNFSFSYTVFYTPTRKLGRLWEYTRNTNTSPITQELRGTWEYRCPFLVEVSKIAAECLQLRRQQVNTSQPPIIEATHRQTRDVPVEEVSVSDLIALLDDPPPAKRKKKSYVSFFPIFTDSSSEESEL